jgi:serine/tyrosine/threonine adenylyltransferase
MAETTVDCPHIAFDNSYAKLPEHFSVRLSPTPVREPRLIRVNEPLARQLGINPAELKSTEGVEVLAGNRLAMGSEPLAMAYAGHQFGSFVPQLGDGRAILLGEIVDTNGVRCDIQLKGSGPTPFSRRGDGRAALGPVLREYIVSEAMAALGIPTTRALAAVLTGQAVLRDRALPGAVLTRVAASHIRVGTFQYFAVRGDVDGVRTLADHVIARHYPHVAQDEHPYAKLLDAVVVRQAALIAQWMMVGFIHGVMNTDNCSIAGETLDYGPCAFLDAYDPAKVYSSIDHQGRYAFGNQPRIAQWNLAQLAETLLPLLAQSHEQAIEFAQVSVASFVPQFEAALATALLKKIGLSTREGDDVRLGLDLLERMATNEADFTLTFRCLAEAEVSSDSDTGPRHLFKDPDAFDDWAELWRKRLAREPVEPAQRREAMRRTNPKFIPRNHRVEQAIVAAVEEADFTPFERLLAVVSAPYDEQPANNDHAQPPTVDEQVRETFCGT